jgi:hypothetical protein
MTQTPDNYDAYVTHEREAARQRRLRRRREWDYGEGADWEYQRRLEEEREEAWQYQC